MDRIEKPFASAAAPLAAARQSTKEPEAMSEPDPVIAQIARLNELAKAAAAETMDVPATLSRLIREGAAAEVDASILLGILIEGFVHVLSRYVPEEARHEVGSHGIGMLFERLAMVGIEWPPRSK